MAIQKSITAKNGLVGNYTRIELIDVFPNQAGVRAFTKLYASSGAYLTGARPIGDDSIVLTGSDNPLTLNALVNLIEQKLIQLPGNLLSGSQVG